MAQRAGHDQDEFLASTLQDPEVRPLLDEMKLLGGARVGERLPGAFSDVMITRTRNYPLDQDALPVLVVHGTTAPLVPFEQNGKVLGQRIPGAALLSVSGDEHVNIFTHRGTVTPRVVQFLHAVASVETEDRATAPLFGMTQ
jgi:hypothetical protein